MKFFPAFGYEEYSGSNQEKWLFTCKFLLKREQKVFCNMCVCVFRTVILFWMNVFSFILWIFCAPVPTHRWENMFGLWAKHHDKICWFSPNKRNIFYFLFLHWRQLIYIRGSGILQESCFWPVDFLLVPKWTHQKTN